MAKISSTDSTTTNPAPAAAAPTGLTGTDISNAADTVVQAFFGAIAGVAQATAFEKAEFAQLISDIHRYNEEAQSGALSPDVAQMFINDAIDDTQSTVATAQALRDDTATIAMHTAMKALQTLIQTTLSSAFAGFKFAL